MGKNLVLMSEAVICDAIKFLIMNSQQSDGSFSEVGRVVNVDMMVRAMIKKKTQILKPNATKTIKNTPLYVCVCVCVHV